MRRPGLAETRDALTTPQERELVAGAFRMWGSALLAVVALWAVVLVLVALGVVQ